MKIPKHIVEEHNLDQADLQLILEGKEFFPLSINRIYRAGPFGALTLTKEAISYKNRLNKKLGEMITWLPPIPKPRLYKFIMVICGPVIKNKTFGKKHGAKDLVKRYDVNNPIKHIQDALFDILQLEDHWIVENRNIKQYTEQYLLGLFLFVVGREKTKLFLDVEDNLINTWEEGNVHQRK